MEEANLFLLKCMCTCTCVYCCACVFLPYQSVSTVLIGQKIFPLMCLGMGEGGKEGEGVRQLSLSLRALKRNIYLSTFPGMRRAQDQVGGLIAHMHIQATAEIIKIATTISKAQACCCLHCGRQKADADASQRAGSLSNRSCYVETTRRKEYHY